MKYKKNWSKWKKNVDFFFLERSEWKEEDESMKIMNKAREERRKKSIKKIVKGKRRKWEKKDEGIQTKNNEKK